jgi:predicted metal-dependent hydrolase
VTSVERREQREVLERLRADARALAARFALPLLALDAEQPRVKRRYGICYSDGSIRVRLRHVRTGRLLKYSSLVDTLCHELAHLRHFDHGMRFQVFYRRILEHARRRGIYRPAPRGAAPRRPPAQIPPSLTRPQRPALPVQLELFGPWRRR